jgi:hypothetical protein
VAYNFQVGNNKTKLTEYESVIENVLFGNALLAALLSAEHMTSILKMVTLQEKVPGLKIMGHGNPDNNLGSPGISYVISFCVCVCVCHKFGTNLYFTLSGAIPGFELRNVYALHIY